MKKIIFICILLFLISFQHYNEIVPTSPEEIFHEMSRDHILGTDYLGRDIFNLMKIGFFRTAVVVLIGNGIGFSLGTILGIVSGYLGGKWLLISRSLSDIMLVMPSFIVAIIVTSIFGLTPISAGLALGIFDIGVYMKHTASLTQKIRNSEFITMAKLMNIPTHKILLNHILPNISKSLTTLLQTNPIS